MLPLYFTESLNQHFCKHLRGTLVNKNKMLTLLLLSNATIIIKKELKLQYCESWYGILQLAIILDIILYTEMTKIKQILVKGLL